MTAVPRAAVLGFPVSHSLSPVMHNHWLKTYGIDASYTSMAVLPENLKAALHLLRDRGFAGCNLTMPLKEAALPLMDDHDESCLMSGAINTVVIRDGKFIGFNSDGFGFVESLTAQAPLWSGAHVVVVGAGGAARGIVASLQGNGAAHFTLVNRTPERAERIVKQFALPSADIASWDDRHAALAGASLLINCTSLGQEGHPPLELDLAALPPGAVVADIVYRPLETALLQSARARGLRTAEGLSMLLHQGRLGFEHWFGVDPAVTPELRQLLQDQMNAPIERASA